MLLTIFTEKTSKRIVSRDASDNFHRKNFQKDRKLKMEKKSPKKWKKFPEEFWTLLKVNHIGQVQASRQTSPIKPLSHAKERWY